MADPAAFDFFFQQADVDRDGKVSGAEAIHFFKGSNLPQPVLAKIWHAADNGHTGFLSRPEFYNALKLVTVAQSGRELTPDIMRAALVGPASLKIPAPKIQLQGQAPGQQQQASPSPAAPPAQLTSAPPQPPVQNNPTFGVGQPRSSFTGGSTTPPPSYTGAITVQLQQQTPSFPTPQFQQAPSFTSATAAPPQPPPQQSPSFTQTRPVYQQQQQAPVPRPASSGGAGADPWRPTGVQGQLFSSAAPIRSTTSGLPNQGFSPSNGPSSNFYQANAGAPRPGSGGFDSPFGSDAFAAAPTSRPAIDPSFAAPSPRQQPQPRAMQGFRPTAGVAWPKMTTIDLQRYSRVFADVDSDKDGKITGIQARDLFLSWRLPRDVLKQVWDLSDQDGDSMLSFREFCTALYLMDRFREGRPLPPVLPAGIHLDEGFAPQQSAVGYNTPSWQRNARPGMPPGAVPQEQFNMTGGFQGQQERNPRVRARANPDINGTNKPVQGEGKVLDSKEKLEYYRNKLQEIVLFKRKCDNRLSEITDRAAVEKREEEIMAKKYEEKYKQALEVNSRLVSEEAAFRETQTLKLELRNAIAEIERGGNSNALLQTRADRIANNLDELEKALIQRGNLLGLKVTGTTKIELPFGWQPGLQENAVEWDEDWDKFDDEGYTTIQGIMDEHPVAGTATVPGWDDNTIFADGFDFASEPIHSEDSIEKPNADSPRAESETSSIKSGVDSPQWSPKSYPSKRSVPGSSPLSANADHSFESHEDDPGFHSSSFDQAPSFDSTDHFDDKPWSSAFANQNDDVWGLGADSPSSSFQVFQLRLANPIPSSFYVKTRTETDMGSLSINSPARSEAKNENDFFNNWSDDLGSASVSVPSTPLFKSESPADQTSYFGQPSRLEL